MSFKLRVLIITVLVGFGVLHVVGGAMMQRASVRQPIEAMILMHHGD